MRHSMQRPEEILKAAGIDYYIDHLSGTVRLSYKNTVHRTVQRELLYDMARDERVIDKLIYDLRREYDDWYNSQRTALTPQLYPGPRTQTGSVLEQPVERAKRPKPEAKPQPKPKVILLCDV